MKFPKPPITFVISKADFDRMHRSTDVVVLEEASPHPSSDDALNQSAALAEAVFGGTTSTVSDCAMKPATMGSAVQA